MLGTFVRIKKRVSGKIKGFLLNNNVSKCAESSSYFNKVTNIEFFTAVETTKMHNLELVQF